MAPSFTWWTQLGAEATLPSESCPQAGCAVVHATTDAVCREHDRLLPFGDRTLRSQLRTLRWVHLPVVAAYPAIRWGHADGTAVVMAVAVAAGLVLLHLRRFVVARRVWATTFIAVVALVALVAVARPAGSSASTTVGLAVGGLAVLLVVALAKTLPVTGYYLASPQARFLWMRPGGDANPSGTYAAVLLVTGAAAIAAAVVRSIAPRTALWWNPLLVVGLVGVGLGVLLVLVDALAEASADVAGPPAPPLLPPGLLEPPAWSDLPAGRRALHRSWLRVRVALAVILRRSHEARTDRAAIVSDTVWCVGVGLASCIRLIVVALRRMVRRLVLPLLVDGALVLAAAACGAAAERYVHYGALADLGMAVVAGVAACLLVGVIVWLHADEPVGIVGRGVCRTLLVLLPSSVVRLSGAALAFWLLEMAFTRSWRMPGPVAWLGVVTLVVAVVAPEPLPAAT